MYNLSRQNATFCSNVISNCPNGKFAILLMQKSNLSHKFSTPPKMMDECFNVASCMELYLLSPACIIMRAQCMCMYMLVKAESCCRKGL